MSSENQIELLEKEVDSFFSSLAIRHYPRNLAAWAVLTKAAIEVQRAAAIEYGAAKHRHATINFSRIAALLLHEINCKGKQSFANRQSFQWSPTFDAVTYRALTEGDGYFHAWANFSFWHEKAFQSRTNSPCGEIYKRGVPPRAAGQGLPEIDIEKRGSEATG